MNVPRRLAAIDIGTNSFHLVVAETRPRGKFVVLDRDKEVVRLGEGMTDMKHLGDAAMGRALAVLKRFALIARTARAPVRAVATSAVREALNRDRFIRRVRRETGIEVEVVNGFEEARLIYLGALQALPVYRKQILLVDIGGGSTEFLVGRAGRVLYANSLKIGAVRLTRRFFPGGKSPQKRVDECRAFLDGELEPIRRAVHREDLEAVVGTSGTILSVASMQRAARGEPAPVDASGVAVTRRDVSDALRRLLAARSEAERAGIPGLDPSRADIIIAGVLILEAVMRNLKLRSLVTSAYALREGVVLDSMHKRAGGRRPLAHLADIRRASVLHLAESCRYDARHARHVTRLALSIFDQTSALHGLDATAREHLEAAGILHDIGYHISHAQHHRHSYYIIRNAELLGFTESEKEIIAQTARYHRKSHPREKHPEFTRLRPEEKETVERLSAVLRIADGLDRRHTGVVRAVRCEKRRGRMLLHLEAARGADCSLEIWGAGRRKELFEALYSRPVEFVLNESRG